MIIAKKLLILLKKHKNITHVVIEKNTFMGADVLKIKELINKNRKLRGRRIEFINKMQRTNKDEKISTVMDPMNNGQIVICSDCEDSSAAVKQVLEFQGQQYTTHDDFIDMISEGENALKEIKVVRPLKVRKLSDLYG